MAGEIWEIGFLFAACYQEQQIKKQDDGYVQRNSLFHGDGLHTHPH